jgi:sporulation protein YlmC with PRC-barrel domain
MPGSGKYPSPIRERTISTHGQWAVSYGALLTVEFIEVTEMDIPINVDVQCADGLCGRLTYVIINPITRRMTHLVVREAKTPHTKRMVPVALVVETTPNLVRMGCTRDELAKMEPFIETEYIRAEIPDVEQIPTGGYLPGEYVLWPYVIPERTEYVPVDHKRIPPGELAVRRGARVEATDGRVGQVDEFLVDPANGHITHLVLREGHLWGQKDVTIPISQIERIEENVVYLKLDKHSIEALPAIPIRRSAA